MGATGRAVIDFGPAPGGDSASVVITGQTGISTAPLSFVEAWIDATVPGGTVDHTNDEHSMADAEVGITCQTIVVGVGFTIVAAVQEQIVYGKFNVAWIWV
jgi:hypothetical protein